MCVYTGSIYWGYAHVFVCCHCIGNMLLVFHIDLSGRIIAYWVFPKALIKILRVDVCLLKKYGINET